MDDPRFCIEEEDVRPGIRAVTERDVRRMLLTVQARLTIVEAEQVVLVSMIEATEELLRLRSAAS